MNYSALKKDENHPPKKKAEGETATKGLFKANRNAAALADPGGPIRGAPTGGGHQSREPDQRHSRPNPTAARDSAVSPVLVARNVLKIHVPCAKLT